MLSLLAGCNQLNPPNPARCQQIFNGMNVGGTGENSDDNLYYNHCTGNGTLDVLETVPNCITFEDVQTAWLNVSILYLFVYFFSSVILILLVFPVSICYSYANSWSDLHSYHLYLRDLMYKRRFMHDSLRPGPAAQVPSTTSPIILRCWLT